MIKRIRGGGIQFHGNFLDWTTAEQNAEGYDAAEILEKVRLATHAVIRGDAACERDSVLLDSIPYPFPLISVLLRAALENDGELNVLDFGGSLGSSYFQCRDFLKNISSLRWRIVEQKHYVKCGKREFENEILKFYENVEAAADEAQPQVIVASGVLQYLPAPDKVLKSFVRTGADYIVIDRTPLSMSGKQIISVQSIPASLIRSSYPLWLFDEQMLKTPLIDSYIEIACYDAIDGYLGSGKLRARYRGWIFSRDVSEGS